MSEKFSLKWNDYQSIWNKAINELRQDTDFADVTLISDDKVRFSAHKILLSSCSNIFKTILKGNTHGNSLLFLGGVSSMNLGFILDYIYQGEVNLYQEQLDSFLESAQMLEIEGLLGGDFDNDSGKKYKKDEEILFEPFADAEPALDQALMKMDANVARIPRKQYKIAKTDVANFDVRSMTSEEIEGKRRELYEKDNGVWRCLACDYTSASIKSSQVRLHVETHLDGLCFTCDICNKEFRSRHMFYQHKKEHQNLNLTISGTEVF